MGTPNGELLTSLDAAIERRHLLNHPFYRDWQEGRLSRAGLQLYAAQYYRHVAAFPKHLRVLASRAQGELRGIILENLAEEENPARPHAKLWRDFAAAVGVSEENLGSCPALPGTQALVETFRKICGERSCAEAVAALYAYESQVPEIATTKMQGLRKFYGITDPQGLAYFEVHEQADKAHRAAWRGWLASHGNDEDADRVLTAAEEALSALWGGLDAIHFARA